MLSNILLSRLIPYADEIIGEHQCGFRRNRSTTDQIFYIRQILEKKWEYNGTVHQLLIDFKKDYDSVRREELYNILIVFGMHRKLVGLGTTLTDQNCIHEEINSRVNSGNACYHSVQSLLSSRLLSRNVKVKIYKTIILPTVLYGCETWSLTLREEHRLRVFENRGSEKNIWA
jgi:hypothetical protein